MSQKRLAPVVVLPGRLMDWHGLRLYREAQSDYFRSKTVPFEWEVDSSLDDDDEYEARVSFRGVKIVTGRGSTRQEALEKALRELTILGSKIGIETHARRESRKTCNPTT